MANWGEYRNIWWNDADLALALAYLLVEGPAAPTCREIMTRLAELRKSEVTEARREAWGKGFTAGSSAFVGAWAVTLLTGGAALPVTAPIMATSLSAGFGSGVVASTLQEAEAGRWRERRVASGRLEREFPRLEELFGGVGGYGDGERGEEGQRDRGVNDDKGKETRWEDPWLPFAHFE